MVEDDLELETDVGEATIVYETPDGETAEKTVPNEHVAYFQDHWIVKRDEDEEGRDLVRRIPTRRVYYVERSVEEFEEEIKTLKDQVQSFAEGLRGRLPVGDAGGERDAEPVRVNVERRGEGDAREE